MPLFWDIETAGLHDGAAITCAVTYDSETDHAVAYHSGGGKPMSASIAQRLADAVVAAPVSVTYNGASFDFARLYAATGDERLKPAMWRHHDVMLQFMADNGYRSKMDAFAKASLGEANSKTNTGDWAARAWFAGNHDEVIDYCESDTRVLCALYNRAIAQGSLERVTAKGKRTVWVVNADPSDASPVWVSVADAQARWQANPPDVAWMTDPPTLTDQTSWAGAATQGP